MWRSAKLLRVGGGRKKATLIYVLYAATAVALVLGMVVSHVPQNRL